MSDIADMCADACGAVEGAGCAFRCGKRRSDGRTGGGALPACACGGSAVYAPHPPIQHAGMPCEVLRCGKCGNQVGPFTSRQLLTMAWRLYGWQANGGAG